MSVDLLVIAAHPDDAELIAGGTIAKMVHQGYRVAIADATRGESGTRGTAEARAEEAARAAEVLGVSERINLDFGDTQVGNGPAERRRVIETIRRFRPSLIMTHCPEDLHPDHVAVHHIVKDTMYASGFRNFPAEGEPFRPDEVLFFMGHFPFEPSFVVDVDDFMERKLESCRCYASQLFQPGKEKDGTNIGKPDFLERIIARARVYGTQIYKSYGEPFLVRRPVPVGDPIALYKPYPKM